MAWNKPGKDTYMDAITELAKINFTSLFISLCILLAGIKAAVSLFGWAAGKLGLETKWQKKRRQEHTLLLNTSQRLIALQEKHEEDMERSDRHDAEMQSDIRKLTDMFIDKQINDYRWEIINLADKIASGKAVSKECLRHALSTYEKYEKIITEHGLINGEVEISIEIIREHYQKKLKEVC